MTALLPEIPDRLIGHTNTHDDIADTLTAAIKNAITQHPRSQQTRIGPSEVGQECARRIAYKLLGQPENSHRDAPWLPTIGTAVHAWLEGVFDNDNLTHAPERDHQERWLVETRVNVGEINGTIITGSADLFDRFTGTVIDWKIVGPTTLRKYKSKGPGQQYRTQAHLYGRGFARAGHQVNRVMIAFLPRNAELTDAHIWSEPYDESIAVAALARATGISLTVNTLGHTGLAAVPTTESYCNFCPYLQRGSTDLSTGCPGAETAIAHTATAQQNQLAGLI